MKNKGTMDKNKQYYLDLAERWFDAETTEAEEADLKAFLAATDDPDFDAARATMGYISVLPNDNLVIPSEAKESPRRTLRLSWTAIAVAASVAVAFFIGRLSATPVELVVQEAGACVSYVHGIEVPGEEFAIRDMETTLGDLFAPSVAPDPVEDLSLIFSNNR